MPNVQWEVPHTITSPLGDLDLNKTDPVTGRRYQIMPDGYRIGPTLRVTQDNKSQADGSVLHPRFKTGLTAIFTIGYMIMVQDGSDYTPACDADLVAMNDLLMAHLNAMRRLTTDTQRLLWTPSGYSGNRRMLDEVQLLDWPTPSRDGIETQQTFAFETPFPYAIDSDQTDTVFLDGETHAIPNDGSSDFSPVMRVGASTAFTITDTVSGMQVVFDSSRTGAVPITGSDYGEIDFFRGTIFLNGDSTDLIAGIDPSLTDFFPIQQSGGTNVSIVGADMNVLSNKAWS